MGMLELRSRSWRRAVRGILATVIAVTAATSLGASASACSGPYVSAVEAIEKAARIALVRTAAVDGDPTFPDGYDFVVEESYRGAFGPVIQVPAPQYHACGDRIVAAPGDRLVIFFDVPAWDGQPPMNPFWRIGPGGALAPDGIDAEMMSWATIDELRAALAGGGTVGETAVATSPGTLDGAPSVLPVLALVLAAVALVFGGVAVRARR